MTLYIPHVILSNFVNYVWYGTFLLFVLCSCGMTVRFSSRATCVRNEKRRRTGDDDASDDASDGDGDANRPQSQRCDLYFLVCCRAPMRRGWHRDRSDGRTCEPNVPAGSDDATTRRRRERSETVTTLGACAIGGACAAAVWWGAGALGRYARATGAGAEAYSGRRSGVGKTLNGAADAAIRQLDGFVRDDAFDDDASLEEKRRADGFIRVVGTHHKTGTSLSADVFRTVSREFAYEFFDLRHAEDSPNASARASLESFRTADIVLDYHFGKTLPRYLAMDPTTRSWRSLTTVGGASDYRVAHVVRDPLATLISGLVYHMRHPADEKWLSDARDELRGQTYAEFLAQASPVDRVRAELVVADEELRALVLTFADCERDRRCINARLEDFDSDFKSTLRRVLRHLQFPRAEVTAMVDLAASLHDTKLWSATEVETNVHLTRNSAERKALFDAALREPDVRRVIWKLRRAMNYTSSKLRS